VRVSTRYGEFVVLNANDLICRSLFHYGEWAQCEIEILSQFIARGDSVVDAGAYIGTHTVAFSLMVGARGCVHSFEPNPQANRVLVANVLANAPDNVKVHESALGEVRSRARLETVGIDNLGATRTLPARKAARKSVAVETLDSFCLKNIKFIKADVEGAEMRLLRGAAVTIGSSRPTIFLECNSLQTIIDLPVWLRQNEYISHGVLVGAFNPSNFNGSMENIFGSSKECGLLLIPKERATSISKTLKMLNLPPVATIDDAALLLLHKPQYAYEVLEKSISAEALGIQFPSPALSDATNKCEVTVRELRSEVQSLQVEGNSLKHSLEQQEDCAAKMDNLRKEAEGKAQAFEIQIASLTKTNESLRQEMLIQASSLHKEIHQSREAQSVLERELQENRLLTQQEIQALERTWEAKLVNQKAQTELQAQAMGEQITSLTGRNQGLQEEMLCKTSNLYKESHEAKQAHVALERELQANLVSAQREIRELDRDWAAKMAELQAERDRKVQDLIGQVDSLSEAMQSVQREALLQRAFFYKAANEAKQAHIALERELQEDLLSAQREIHAVDRDWAAKLADEKAQAEEKAQALALQIAFLTDRAQSIEREMLLQSTALYKEAHETNQAHLAVERQLQDMLSLAQREIHAVERGWAMRVADQETEADRKLQLMTMQVDALTQSLLAAKDEQLRQQTSYSEKSAETSRVHAEVEMDQQRKLLAAQTELEILQMANNRLEIEKSSVEAGLLWRATGRARKMVHAILGKSVPPATISPIRAQSPATRGVEQQNPPDSLKNDSSDAHTGTAIDDAREHEIEEILQSRLFDRDFYLSTYADVASANIDPFFHYMNYGWREGRNPSDSFETLFYLETYPDVKESGVNPLVHYVRFGRSEKRDKAAINTLTDISRFFELFDQTKDVKRIADTLPIDIVIPIYNGFDYLEPLFRSLFSHTSMPYRLIVVEDASPDIRVKQFLREMRRTNTETDIVLIENLENLGFVGSVNRAVSEVRNHFVLLNSDTEVPPNWIERLMYPIFEMENIASTTPFTNSGTICSFPTYLQDNPIFEDLDVEVIDSYFQFVNCARSYLAIPTGIGFCMGINKMVVDQIGMFDEIFGRGYCEENDWCARAEKFGYQNLHVPNLFVYHKHGGSFPSEDRRRLIERNHSLLLEKHPSYDMKVRDFIRMDSLKDLRRFLIMLLSSNEARASVIFDNELGGGAHQFRKGRIEQIVGDGAAVFLISYKDNRDKIATLKFYFRAYRFSFAIKNPEDLVRLFTSIRIDEIIINSFVAFHQVNEWLALAARIRSASGDARVVFMVHDYFAVCPSYTLINDSREYCGVPSDLGICRECLNRNTGDFRRFESHADILTWRTQWANFLRACDEIVCFGGASADILRRAYPSIQTERIVVRPHDITGRFAQMYFGAWKNPIKTIGVLGAINLAKGSNVLRDLVEHIDKRRLSVKVILFGEIDIQIISESFEVTGRYDIECLQSIVLEKKVDVFLLPSIWPETFSFTADEIMQMGFPLIAFNIGAPAERVKAYSLGKVIEVEDLYGTLFGIEGSIRAA
jgi:FkbM family methyltransferase